MQYKLIVNTEDNLEEVIRGYLNDGWELYGNPFFVHPSKGYDIFAQAIVYKN